jgi:hypothetical protein
MSAETIFSICSTLVLPGWLLLIVLPRWKWTLGIISSGIIPFILGLVYVGVFISQSGNSAEGGGFGSLEEVTILFSNPYSMTAGWIHYLAFDLFVGAWEVRDSQKQNISHWLVIPCLLLTFLLGPAGLALYLILRTAMTRKWLIYEPAVKVI